MFRFDGPDGRPLKSVTLRCDQDDAEFLLALLREYIEELEQLAKPGARGEFAAEFASSEPT
jgi:hypothetical protein